MSTHLLKNTTRITSFLCDKHIKCQSQKLLFVEYEKLFLLDTILCQFILVIFGTDVKGNDDNINLNEIENFFLLSCIFLLL